MVKRGNVSLNKQIGSIQEVDKKNADKAILEMFGRIYPLSFELQRTICEQSKLIYCKKKHILANICEIHKNIYFILRGSIRTYLTDKDGNEITSWLLFEGELAVSVLSFFTQKVGFEAMETLEDSVLISLSHASLTKIYKKFVEFNYIGRILTEQYYIRSEEKANSFRMLDASERYHNLLKKQPHIAKRVPLGFIASYLGMKNSTLSRIRKRI